MRTQFLTMSFGAAILASGISGVAAHAVGMAGELGDAKTAGRTVEIVMSDADGKMAFTPDSLEFKRGETVRFVLHNKGVLEHEFVLGSKSANAEHAAMMAKMPDMKHNDPNARSVAPGQTATLVWRFTHAGQFEFACLIAGHYDAGMHGAVSVK